jgi:hypothetical protein
MRVEENAVRGLGDPLDPEDLAGAGLAAAGFGVITVRVANASEFTLAPQEEQKRLLSEIAASQAAHLVMRSPESR